MPRRSTRRPARTYAKVPVVDAKVAHGHGLAALLSIVLLIGALALAVGMHTQASLNNPAASSTEIGIEHADPITVSFTVSSGKKPTLIDVTQTGKFPIHMSLPASWTMREVRYAALADITSEPASFGFIRWTLPAKAILSLTSPTPIEALTINNPSGVPLTAIMTRVDLLTGNVNRSSVMVKEGAAAIK